MNVLFQTHKSPIGTLFLAADEEGLLAVAHEGNWLRIRGAFSEPEEETSAILEACKQQLAEYFGGLRREFSLPLIFQGTKFQNEVWRALLQIPYGETRTYSEQAFAVNSPKAVRAVGRTNGLNPILIVVPCHRVIGSQGALTGYAGGLEAKKYLLELERKSAAEQKSYFPLERMSS